MQSPLSQSISSAWGAGMGTGPIPSQLSGSLSLSIGVGIDDVMGKIISGGRKIGLGVFNFVPRSIGGGLADKFKGKIGFGLFPEGKVGFGLLGSGGR